MNRVHSINYQEMVNKHQIPKSFVHINRKRGIQTSQLGTRHYLLALLLLLSIQLPMTKIQETINTNQYQLVLLKLVKGYMKLGLGNLLELLSCGIKKWLQGIHVYKQPSKPLIQSVWALTSLKIYVLATARGVHLWSHSMKNSVIVLWCFLEVFQFQMFQTLSHVSLGNHLESIPRFSPCKWYVLYNYVATFYLKSNDAITHSSILIYLRCVPKRLFIAYLSLSYDISTCTSVWKNLWK